HTTLFESNLAGRVAAARLRIPVVSSMVNAEYGPEHFADPRLSAVRLRGAQAADVLTGRLVRRWHAITQFVADAMSARLRVRRDRIDVIPRGRDPELLGTRSAERAAATRRALGIGDGVPLVLAAARQEHQKGLDVLLEAWPDVVRRVAAARLVVAGREGNQSPLLREAVHRLGLTESVTFLGVRSDVPDLLAAADAFAFPSRWEGLGSVLLEAMALEAPIVTSDLPPVREIVTHGTDALVVPPESPARLAEAIAETLTERGPAAARAARARRRFLQEFAIGEVADRTVGFYERSLRR
nr:glycosyltransferase family 4 protein [Actinomycetota bacterium]